MQLAGQSVSRTGTSVGLPFAEFRMEAHDAVLPGIREREGPSDRWDKTDL